MLGQWRPPKKAAKMSTVEGGNIVILASGTSLTTDVTQ